MISYTHPVGQPKSEDSKTNPGGVLIGYSQYWRRRVADRTAMGGFTDEDSRTLGVGGRFGANALRFDLKLLATQFRRDSGWKQKLDAVVGVGIRVGDDNWLDLAVIGKLAGETDNKLKLSFTYSFGSKGESTKGK